MFGMVNIFPATVSLIFFSKGLLERVEKATGGCTGEIGPAVRRPVAPENGTELDLVPPATTQTKIHFVPRTNCPLRRLFCPIKRVWSFAQIINKNRDNHAMKESASLIRPQNGNQAWLYKA